MFCDDVHFLSMSVVLGIGRVVRANRKKFYIFNYCFVRANRKKFCIFNYCLNNIDTL